MKYWITPVFIDALVAAMFYAWQVHGVLGAGRAFIFAVIVTSVMAFIAAFSSGKTGFKPRPRGFVQYHFVTEVFFILALAWVGHQWIAAFYMAGSILVESARMRDAKAKAGGAA